MKQAAAMHWIILFVGLLINIDTGDCAIRAEGDYKTVNYCGRKSILIKSVLFVPMTLIMYRLLGPVGRLVSVSPGAGLWVWLGAEDPGQETSDHGDCDQCGQPQVRASEDIKSENCGPGEPQVTSDF